jgi:hypothetical protein
LINHTYGSKKSGFANCTVAQVLIHLRYIPTCAHTHSLQFHVAFFLLLTVKQPWKIIAASDFSINSSNTTYILFTFDAVKAFWHHRWSFPSTSIFTRFPSSFFFCKRARPFLRATSANVATRRAHTRTKVGCCHTQTFDLARSQVYEFYCAV